MLLDATVDIPPGDPTNDMRPDKPRPCVACSGHHGSVGAGFNCLEGSVVTYRAMATELARENERLRKVIACGAVTPEQFEANRKASEHFDRTRGRLKPSL